MQKLLNELAEKSTGSATLVKRAVLADFDLSIDKGEITDKGTINQKRVIENHPEIIRLLYANPPGEVIIEAEPDFIKETQRTGMNIKNIPVIITGGASGLGEATARLLAGAGAKVLILDLNNALAERVAKEINGIAIKCDVADEENAKEAVAKAKAVHGVARVLVNCAGIGGATRIVGREGPMPLSDFEKIIKINLIGSFNMMRLVAADMITAETTKDGERGVIISTASVAAYEGQIGQAAYAASKGGIVSLTLPAAREFSQFGIRVNAIAPGLFSTPLLEGLI